MCRFTVFGSGTCLWRRGAISRNSPALHTTRYSAEEPIFFSHRFCLFAHFWIVRRLPCFLGTLFANASFGGCLWGMGTMHPFYRSLYCYAFHAQRMGGLAYAFELSRHSVIGSDPGCHFVRCLACTRRRVLSFRSPLHQTKPQPTFAIQWQCLNVCEVPNTQESWQNEATHGCVLAATVPCQRVLAE